MITIKDIYKTKETTNRMIRDGLDSWIKFDKALSSVDFNNQKSRNDLLVSFYSSCRYVSDNLCNKILGLLKTNICEQCVMSNLCNGGIQEKIAKLIKAMTDGEPVSRLEKMRSEIMALTDERNMIVQKMVE